MLKKPFKLRSIPFPEVTFILHIPGVGVAIAMALAPVGVDTDGVIIEGVAP